MFDIDSVLALLNSPFRVPVFSCQPEIAASSRYQHDHYNVSREAEYVNTWYVMVININHIMSLIWFLSLSYGVQLRRRFNYPIMLIQRHCDLKSPLLYKSIDSLSRGITHFWLILLPVRNPSVSAMNWFHDLLHYLMFAVNIFQT